MIDQTYLKTLTVLYVEDDDTTRKTIGSVFGQLFKKVIITSDGLEALKAYHQANKSSTYIDMIISDISMPNMDGVELLTEIRKLDNFIPFIFTTAYSNTEFLLSSIQQGITDYFVKPVNTKEMITTVQKACTLKQKERTLILYQEEIKKYMDVVDKVAMVSIFDEKLKLIFANEFFKEVSSYRDEELLGKDYKIIAHPEVDRSFFDKQQQTLVQKKVWKGKVKHLSKNGATFFTNTTIMPMQSEGSQIKYISIKFLTTKEDNEKRAFKRKVICNLQETKRINEVAKQKIDVLKQEIQRYKSLDKVEEKLEKQKEVSHKYYEKIQVLEKKLITLQNAYEQTTLDASKQLREVLSSVTQSRAKKEKYKKDSVVVKKEIKARIEMIKQLKGQISQQSKKIEDLKDVIHHRQSQLENKTYRPYDG